MTLNDDICGLFPTKEEELQMKVKLITNLVTDFGYASDHLTFLIAVLLGVEGQLKDIEEESVR